MKFLYTLGIRLYLTGIHLASFFNPKAKKWIEGRRNLWDDLATKLEKSSFHQGSQKVWIHCASLGEFEQGRPLIEKIRKEIPGAKILLTFFSPSGFEVRKNYAEADVICYLPIDLPGNTKKFLDLVNPHKVVFVKYEFWFNFLTEIQKRGIPHFLISGIFRTSHSFFKWYGGWFISILKKYDRLFLQDESSLKLLEQAGITNAEVAGDTRFDRVSALAHSNAEEPLSAIFSRQGKTLVCGSTWPADEELIATWSEHSPEGKEYKIILAPHELGVDHINSILSRFSFLNPICHSKVVGEDIPSSCRMLIIDHIGSLSKIYRYGQWSYIGGGFGAGIHNILEAAVYGKPVLFGPTFQKFNEAHELIEAGGAFSVNNAKELTEKVHFLHSDPRMLLMASMASKEYVLRRTGATPKLFSQIFPS